MDNMKYRINIQKYASLFHDGAIRKIQHINNTLLISMESAQVLPKWNEDHIALSKRDTISGILFIETVKSIKEDDTFLKEFKTKDSYDRAGIFDFEVNFNRIILIIWWVKYLLRYEQSDFFRYEIEAEKIYWENIPTLFDDYWDSL